MSENCNSVTQTRDIVVDYGSGRGYVSVMPHHTLSDVRQLIIEEFDEDMIPGGSPSGDGCPLRGAFCFQIDGIRLSSKQEGKKIVHDLFDANNEMKRSLSIHAIQSFVGQGKHKISEEATSSCKMPRLVSPQARKRDIDGKQSCKNMLQEHPQGEGANVDPTKSSFSEEMHRNMNLENSENNDLQKEESEGAFKHCQVGPTQDTREENIGNLDFPLDNMDISEKDAISSVASSFSSTSEIEEERYDVSALNCDENAGYAAENIFDKSAKNSLRVLKGIAASLKENPYFATEDRLKDWLKDIENLKSKLSPQAVIGVVGNTGAGKSSLLNALLGEASVLPTSGSRGCTAAVVELRYNTKLMASDQLGNPLVQPSKKEAVYKGTVEFITPEEWGTELRILVRECCSDGENIDKFCPNEPTSKAAWSKINKVYGEGKLEEFYGDVCEEEVYNELWNDERVQDLLTPTEVGDAYNSHEIIEGKILTSTDEAINLANGCPSTSLISKKKSWANSFRAKLNEYVYRKGDGNGPQTWPLIRKVILHGPWPVLKGACLVDLPGVRDNNVARAKVAESYLQNCDRVWIVAPIRRAVDDATARELLGEQFKRRMLMDGQYSNISFICTQTDDCETTEIMQDHQDIAKRQPDRWEHMVDLQRKITDIQNEKKNQDKSKLKKESTFIEYIEKAIKKKRKETQSNSEVKVLLGGIKEALKKCDELIEYYTEENERKANKLSRGKNKLINSRELCNSKLKELEIESEPLQKELKLICATVRNEYSASHLRNDFQAGLKEILTSSNDEATPDDIRSNCFDTSGIVEDNDNESQSESKENSSNDDLLDDSTPLIENADIKVFCTSANDFLKIEGIKPPTDGHPCTFLEANETQIPMLRNFVHEVATKETASIVKSVAYMVVNLLDRIKLFAVGVGNPETRRVAMESKSIYEETLKSLSEDTEDIANSCATFLEQRVQLNLTPNIKTGATKGEEAAMKTVESWKSPTTRSKGGTGLHWASYLATIYRDGIYHSLTYGDINLNEELYCPMEKQYATSWAHTMKEANDSINDAKKKMEELSKKMNEAVSNSLSGIDICNRNFISMLEAANCSSSMALKLHFKSIASHLSDEQRRISRTIEEEVQKCMKEAYQQTSDVRRGRGLYIRLTDTMKKNATEITTSMFDCAATSLIEQVHRLIRDLKDLLVDTQNVIYQSLINVYSVCWEVIDDENKVKESRDQVLRNLDALKQQQDIILASVDVDVAELLGFENEESVDK